MLGNCNCEIQQNPDSEKKLETQFSLKLFHFSQGRLEINPWKSGGVVVIIIIDETWKKSKIYYMNASLVLSMPHLSTNVTTFAILHVDQKSRCNTQYRTEQNAHSLHLQTVLLSPRDHFYLRQELLTCLVSLYTHAYPFTIQYQQHTHSARCFLAWLSLCFKTRVRLLC